MQRFRMRSGHKAIRSTGVQSEELKLYDRAYRFRHGPRELVSAEYRCGE